MYSVQILKSATRELEQLDKTMGLRITKRINWLAQNLDNIKLEALKGELAGLYKAREGDFRIIYEVLKNENLILVHAIGHRREVYRRKK